MDGCLYGDGECCGGDEREREEHVTFFLLALTRTRISPRNQISLWHKLVTAYGYYSGSDKGSVYQES